VPFRAALSYHPGVATFRKGRGAWLVVRCWPVACAEPLPCVVGKDYTRRIAFLVVSSMHRLRPGDFANPTRLMRQWHDRTTGATK